MSEGTQRRIAVVIEDDADIRNLLEAVLTQAGFRTFSAASGLDGINAVREHNPSVTTLDISLPGIDGYEVARRIRAFSNTYIIMLSARSEEIDTLMGLDAGADDYLTKPFRPRELRARIESMLRRSQSSYPDDLKGPQAAVRSPAAAGSSPAPPEPVKTKTPPAGTEAETDDGWLTHNGLRINPEMRLCELRGSVLELTRSEFDLLIAIMVRRRRVITKNELALELRGDSDVGGYVSDSDRRAVEVHLANLRRKLNDSVASPLFVETVRGVGYRLAPSR